MTYERIFWLDSYPAFFDRLERTELEEDQSLDIGALVRRTRFAFDLEMARELVKAQEFDLYVLNCNPPNKMPDPRRAQLQVYLGKIAEGSADYTVTFLLSIMMMTKFL
jgi:hypothetical protein